MDNGKVEELNMKKDQEAKISDQDVRTFYDQNLDLFTREDGKVTEFSFIRDSIRTLIRNQAETKAMDEFLAGKARGPNDGDFDCVSLAHVLCVVRCFGVN